MIYVDPDHELVAVVRWIDNQSIDGFLKRLLAAVHAALAADGYAPMRLEAVATTAARE